MEYLKIKEDIDLKELEKLGFKLYGSFCPYYKYIDGAQISSIEITRTKNISIYTDRSYVADAVINKLYDLFKADLIEKVVEE